tara:strand:+ start:706 stop:1038 length:333 start_codon:yes stop_codon:yes gene_type:complete
MEDIEKERADFAIKVIDNIIPRSMFPHQCHGCKKEDYYGMFYMQHVSRNDFPFICSECIKKDCIITARSSRINNQKIAAKYTLLRFSDLYPEHYERVVGSHLTKSALKKC